MRGHINEPVDKERRSPKVFQGVLVGFAATCCLLLVVATFRGRGPLVKGVTQSVPVYQCQSASGPPLNPVPPPPPQEGTFAARFDGLVFGSR